MTYDNVDVDGQVIFNRDGTVDITFKNVRPEDVSDLFYTLGTDQGQESFLASLEKNMKPLEDCV